MPPIALEIKFWRDPVYAQKGQSHFRIMTQIDHLTIPDVESVCAQYLM